MNKNFDALVDKSFRGLRDYYRPLETARLEYLFLDGSAEQVFRCLASFQNSDGGFGNGLEPDFVLPYSSPMATSIGLEVLAESGAPPDNPLVKDAIRYLYETYRVDGSGWIDVPAAVNEYPHAPWWHYKTDEEKSAMQEYWGNPSAELIGHLARYNPGDPRVELMVQEASGRLLDTGDVMETHELYCFLRFYDSLPREQQAPLEDTLRALVAAAVCLDPAEWHTYKPQPIDFVKNKESFLYEEYSAALRQNIQYLLETVAADGMWQPSWAWDETYPKAWETARAEWSGVLAVKHLSAISEFME